MLTQKINYFVFMFLAVFCAFTAFVGCDSPRNHRVENYSFESEMNLNSQTFKKHNLTIKSMWAEGPYPSISKTSSILVFVYDSQGELVDVPEDLTLGFWAIMPSMGHGLDDAGFFERLSEGVYENKNIVFQMPGDWQMEVSLLDDDFNEQDKVLWSEFF